MNYPDQYSHQCRLEQPGNGESTTTNGSFDGLFQEGVQTQQSDTTELILRYPAQKGFTLKGMGRREGFTQSPSSIPDAVSRHTPRRISHFIFNRYIDIIKMILLLFLTVTLATAQVSHNPIIPKIEIVRFTPNIKSVPSATAFKANFPGLGYQIGGAVYETHNGLLNEELHNRTFYNKSKACQLYNSQLRLQVIDDLQLSTGVTIQSVSVSDTFNAMFTIQSDNSYRDQQLNINRLLIAYDFNSSGIYRRPKNISIGSLGLNTSESLNIVLLCIGKTLIITDGVKLVGLDIIDFTKYKQLSIDLKNFVKYDYDYVSSNNLLHFEATYFDPTTNNAQIVATWNKAIRIYNITENVSKATLITELLPPNGSQLTDAVPDIGRFWALTEGFLLAYRQNAAGQYQMSKVQLQSKDCFHLNKYETTVHIICREGGLNYVGQYFLNQSFIEPSQALRLNRYYMQIDDARVLFRFGGDYNPKLVISGDYDIFVVPYAINRQALLESVNLPRGHRVRSLGIEEVHWLRAHSNFTYNMGIGAGDGYVVLFAVREEAPTLECMVTRTNEDIRWNLLVEINTSSCLANGDWEQLESICSYEMPFTLYASMLEVEASKHTTIVATTIIILLAVVILLVGSALYCRNNIKRAGNELKKKLAALKQKKGMKPI